jgi:uncharacterized protein (DUF169 family)
MSANFDEATDTLLRYVRVQTSPLAVKHVDSAREFPSNFERPSKMGLKMKLCQVATIVRKWRRPFAVAGEDLNCAAALLYLGWGEFGPEINREEAVANFRVDAGYIKDLERSKDYSKFMATLQSEKKYSAKGILIAPLDSDIIEDPDVILIYGNPAQIVLLVQSWTYMEARVVESWAGTGASCIQEVVVPMLENKARYILPGRGARKHGMAGDDEMVFSLPAEKLEDLLTGITESSDKGSPYPTLQSLFFEPRTNQAAEDLFAKVKLIKD